MTTVEQLIEQLTSSDGPTRSKATKALVDMGSSAVDGLVAALDKHTEWQQRAIVSVLGSIKDPRAAQPLLRLLSAADPQTRASAAAALGNMQDKSGVETIRQLALDETDSFRRASLVEVLYKLGETSWALDYARQILTGTTASNNDRQAMIQMIVRLKSPTTADLLLEALKAQEFGIWHHALDALKTFQDRRAVDVLLPLLQHQEANRRGTAAAALGDFGDERAVEPLKALLHDKAIAWQGDRPGEPSTTVAEAAQNALKKLQPESNKPRWKLW